MNNDFYGAQKTQERCDSCGAPLDEDDLPVHLCKVCQGDIIGRGF